MREMDDLEQPVSVTSDSACDIGGMDSFESFGNSKCLERVASHDSLQSSGALEDPKELFGGPDVIFDLEWELCTEQRPDAVALGGDLGLSQVPRGRLLDSDNMSQMFESAYISTRKKQKIEMPWERDPVKQIFNKGTLWPKPLQGLESTWVGWSPPVYEDGLDEFMASSSSGVSGGRPLFEQALMAISDKTFSEQKAEQVNDAVEKWLSILRLHPEASSTGRLLLENAPAEQCKSEARRTIEATLGVKSKATAIARANAFLKFIEWRELDGGKVDSSEVLELDVWQYFCHLQDSSAAPTRAQSLLSALNYMRYVLGYSVFQPICESKRLSGLADLLLSAKAPLRQSRVLTVDQVMWLHGRLEDPNTHPTDKAILAYIITALYGRCRHSDLANVERVLQDFDEEGGFLEIQTRSHKTAKSAASKAVLLPIVVPAVGVTGKVWVHHAVDAFNNVGLQYTGEIQGPLYRPPAGAGENCKRGITSMEVTKFLRACFEDGPLDSRLGRVSSHSLKATALSWAAKACLDPADRAVLGRHSSAFQETSAIYSRDNSIRAVTHLQNVLLAIYAQEFLPDCERSCYFPKTSQTVSSEVGQFNRPVKSGEDVWSMVGKTEASSEHLVIDLEAEQVCSSSEEESGSEEELESEHEAPALPHGVRHILSQATAAHFVKHKVSKIVHFKDHEPGKVCRTLSCGRMLNGNYETADKFDTFDMCKRCRQNADKDGILKRS